MKHHHVRSRLEHVEDFLSPYASKISGSRGRVLPESPSPLRTDFQRDRDRIIHSKAFRRLKHKTQVFIAPQGDHYVTRLTHTLEVSQIARTIARALNLNEDLEEAISLGHDLGHTPFGHIGEETLNGLAPMGFSHSQQSLRIVETLEKEGEGLNLMWEVRQGIVSHSKPQGDFLDQGLTRELTLEAQICRLSDAVAYLNHDIEDARRAGLLREDELPTEVKTNLGTRHSERIDAMVADVVEASWACTGLEIDDNGGTPAITMSTGMRETLNTLRAFMFERVYLPSNNNVQGLKAREMVEFLYRYFESNPDQIPHEYRQRNESIERMVIDYISAMTDYYAIRKVEEISPGLSNGVFN
ncbi:MAG: deoxyguanosinetriphosphate triphosphohydrolase [Chloroflexota bacterium]|nr:deoxyguanosinetriphosphate triphosphohydrolase [Chloroflexota bacterium]